MKLDTKYNLGDLVYWVRSTDQAPCSGVIVTIRYDSHEDSQNFHYTVECGDYELYLYDGTPNVQVLQYNKDKEI